MENNFFLNTKRTMIDWNVLNHHLFYEGKLSKATIFRILDEVKKFFKAEPNMIYLEDPVTIVGDIHGQFYDIKEIFRIGGIPGQNKYLFLGDYIDRGIYGMEVILSFFSLKINCPNQVFMLRGNHETRTLASCYGFMQECFQKYDQEVYDKIMEVFDLLPLAAIVNGNYLCVHGGISPSIQNCHEINKLNRQVEPEQYGGICDMLWADPVQQQNGELPQMWINNEIRGCSYYFGKHAANNFLKKNKLIGIIRAHEAEYEGFKTFLWDGPNNYPQVITLFSAPNYCGTYANKGAVGLLQNNDMKIIQFSFTPKTDLLLQLGDAFSWSIPILRNNLMNIFIEFLSFTNDQVLDTRKTEDISLLDDTVLNALDINQNEKNQISSEKNVELSFLEQLVEEQKMKKQFSNKQLIRRISGGIDVEIINHLDDQKNNGILQESFPDHFNLMKNQDSINEGLPHDLASPKKNQLKFNLIFQISIYQQKFNQFIYFLIFQLNLSISINLHLIISHFHHLQKLSQKLALH